MLIDLHIVPGDRSPTELAEAVVASGLDAVVVTDRNRIDRTDDYVAALTDAGISAYVGVELALEAGSLVLVPRDADDPSFRDARWKPDTGTWTVSDARDAVQGIDGALIAGHPYCRDLGSVLGDRVYRVKGLAAVETRAGRGKVSWDRLAEHAATKAQAAHVGSAGGRLDFLGSAATVFPGEAGDQAALVDALREGTCLPVEFEDPADPRDRKPPDPPPRREDRGDRDGRGRGGRDRDRGGRGGRDRGGRDRGGRGGGGGGGRGRR